MLRLAAEDQLDLTALGLHPAEQAIVRHLLQYTRSQGAEPVILTNAEGAPATLVVSAGPSLLCYAQEAAGYASAFSDLAVMSVEPTGCWPGPLLLEIWGKYGCRSLFLDTCPLDAFKAALECGFQVAEDPDFHHHAYCHYWRGPARFSGFQRHSCRQGRGLELAALLQAGIGYDPDGHYVRRCLANGPSFACEVEGQVCSVSTRHVNGSLGMIYTPEEFRGRGYGKSLTAFALDHVLAAENEAYCHVVNGNTASLSMLKAFEPEILTSRPIVWRPLYFPGETIPVRDG